MGSPFEPTASDSFRPDAIRHGRPCRGPSRRLERSPLRDKPRRLRGSGRPRHRVHRGAQRSQGTADLICSDGTVPPNYPQMWYAGSGCHYVPRRRHGRTRSKMGGSSSWPATSRRADGLSLTEHSPGLSRSSSSGPWKECGPEIRRSCDARHCDRRHPPHDDWHTIRPARDLIAAPPLELWPQRVARVPFPKTWCGGCCSPRARSRTP